MAEITDPKSHTILLIEAHGRNVPWAKPSDLTFDEAIQLLTGETVLNDMHEYRPTEGFVAHILGKTGSGIHVAMADGTVRFLTLPIPKELAVALLTINGGEGEVHNQLDEYCRPRLDVGKCYSLGVFVALSLLPAAFMRRHMSNTE